MSATLAEQVTTKDPAERITLDEIESRCASATRLAFKGDRYGTEAIEEAEARLIMSVWEGIPRHAWTTAQRDHKVRTSLRGEAVVYAGRNGAKSLDANRLEMRRTAVPAFLVPHWSDLYGRACNLRRAYDRWHATQLAAQGCELDAERITTNREGNRAQLRTTAQAHRDALSMLDALGLRPLRKGDGNLYALAYTAARWPTLFALDVATPGEVIAEELSMTHKGYRDALSRAAKRVPSIQAHAEQGPAWLALSETDRRKRGIRPLYADALGLPIGGVALKPSRSRTMAATANDTGWRDAQPTDAPLGDATPSEEHRAAAALAGCVLIAACTRYGLRPTRAPQWAKGLNANQRARLAKAAALSIGKAQREAAQREERARIRQEAADAVSV